MHTHKSSEARVRSRISTTRRLQGNRTQSRSFAEVLHYLECRTIDKSEKRFWEIFLRFDEQFILSEDCGNVRKHRDFKLVWQLRKRRSYLVLEKNCCTTKFSEKLLAIEIKKAKVTLNMPVYLVLSISDISKIVLRWISALQATASGR